MQIGPTRDKLNEAKYFLKTAIAFPIHTDDFRYNLGAFLSSAQSVIFVMNKEFAHVPGYLEWWKKRSEPVQQDGLMRYLKEHRNIVLKKRTVQMLPYVSIFERAVPTGNPEIATVYYIMGTAGTLPIATSQSYLTAAQPAVDLCYFCDIEDKDAITICKKHIAKLEAIVDECEGQFSKK